MIKKKFKIRVKYFTECKYEIQYSSYYFIPIYKSLLFWFEQSLTSGTQCWSVRLFNYEDAEKLAKTLKSIEDIKRWYEKDKLKSEDFYKRRKEYYDTKVPYNIKYF